MTDPHLFCDEGIVIDLRRLVAAEVYEMPGQDGRLCYSIGCLLEVGSTPQRLSVDYHHRVARDAAFARLTALVQTRHTPMLESEDD